MIFASLLLLAADVPQALLDRADAANAAYTGCLFRITREARDDGLTVDQFERRLANSCQDEERSVQQVGSRIFALRGDRSPDAKADALILTIRRGMIENYRKLPEQEQALEEMRRVCRQNLEACRL